MNNPKLSLSKRNSLNLSKTPISYTPKAPTLTDQPTYHLNSRPNSHKSTKKDYQNPTKLTQISDVPILSKAPPGLTNAIKNIVRKKTDIIGKKDYSNTDRYEDNGGLGLVGGVRRRGVVDGIFRTEG
jgi:hypothetical protein